MTALQSVLSRHRTRGAARRVWRRPPISEYLTDGTHLYRFLGWGLAGDFAELEDCRSLELLVVPTCELRAGWLRPVPAASSLAQAS